MLPHRLDCSMLLMEFFCSLQLLRLSNIFLLLRLDLIGLRFLSQVVMVCVVWSSTQVRVGLNSKWKGTFLKAAASNNWFLKILYRRLDQLQEICIGQLNFSIQQLTITLSTLSLPVFAIITLQAGEERREGGQFLLSRVEMQLSQQSTLHKMKVLLFACLVWAVVSVPKQTPIIGIYTQSDTSDQPKGELLGSADGLSNYTYIAASYVKFIEMSGAQVVPIFAYTKNRTYFDALLPKLNGVLFPGGGEAISIGNIWTSNADYILKYAISENKKGNPFPVWGTCLGWELLAYLTSGYDSKVLSSVRGESAVRNRIAIKSPSYLFDDLSTTLKSNLQNGDGLLYFNHIKAVSTTYYQTNAVLKSFWNVVSTTTSSYNELFISAVESKEYPIYAVQFHPEKNLFEWKVFADRSQNGAEIVQILSNKFIEKARASKNSFNSPQEFYKASIYTHKTQSTTQSFSRIYLFNEVHSPAPTQQASQQQLHLLTE